jgi:hypothetical protein
LPLKLQSAIQSHGHCWASSFPYRTVPIAWYPAWQDHGCKDRYEEARVIVDSLAVKGSQHARQGPLTSGRGSAPSCTCPLNARISKLVKPISKHDVTNADIVFTVTSRDIGRFFQLLGLPPGAGAEENGKGSQSMCILRWEQPLHRAV